MAKLVEIDLTDIHSGMLMAKIQAGTLLTWICRYSKVDGTPYTCTSDDEPYKLQFDIGTPDELRDFVNNFDVALHNTSHKEKPYDLIVEWIHQDRIPPEEVIGRGLFGEVDEEEVTAAAVLEQTTLGRWEKTGMLAPGKTLVLKAGVQFFKSQD
ncbi:MAG: hypothetical protein H6555_09005 [Lewinellaceae bacterium]|nr:hypothetical protein [Lewinellaceae bacterium]